MKIFFSLWELDHRFIKQISNLVDCWLKFKWQVFPSSKSFIFPPLYAVFLSVFVFVFLFVSASVTYVSVHLNLLASSILKCVCGWEVDWSERQRQVAHWNQSTISVVLIFIISFIIIRPWPLRLWRLINTVWPWMFVEFSTYHEARLRLYIFARIFFLQCWSLFSPNFTILSSEFDSMVLDSGGLVWSAAGSTCKVKISQLSTTSTQRGKSNKIKII